MLTLILLAVSALVCASRLADPTVQLDDATVTGSSTGRTSSFLGIPFSRPPIGDRRFRVPEPIPPYNESFTAIAFGPACPQQELDTSVVNNLPQEALDYFFNTVYGAVFPDSEDCLQVNVVKPAGATPDSKLPVAVWIFGGGFELGSPSMYDGKVVVEKSIDLEQPVVYVSINYRVTAFGFLAGQEVKDAGIGNLGLLDQREAFRWVQKYIGAFGGDPEKVTIWGESAGAISVALHMLANNGNTEGLFRAGFMESGAPIPVGQIDSTSGQRYFDDLVADTSCSEASDKLECLRGVPYQTLKDAANNSPNIFSYQSLALAWLPRADGTFLTDDPQRLVQQGKVARIPFVSGNCDDEGTLFSLSTLNITTDDELRDYLQLDWLPDAAETDIEQVLSLYPHDPAEGSPYLTGIFNVLTPQFKRIASFQGDVVFQAPRRYFFEQVSEQQDSWSFLNKRLKTVPVLGSFHVSDILNIYGPGDMTDYLIHFVNNLDPNGDTGIEWPKYSVDDPNMLVFQDGVIPLALAKDDFRKEPIEFMMGIVLENPL